MKKSFLLLLLAIWLPSCGEYEEKTRDIGYKGLAKVDHFLAARRMSEELGWTAFSYSGVPGFPPPADATLVVPVASLQSDGVLAEVEEWLTSGGNLIAYLTPPDERWQRSEVSRDWENFLDYFQFEVSLVKDLQPAEYAHLLPESEESEESGGLQSEEELTLQSLSLDREEDYLTEFETNLLIRDTEFEGSTYSGAESYDFGEGTLTVLATAQPLSNEGIASGEHATLLHDLIAMGRGGEVWFIYSTRISFFGLLWQRAPYAVLALGVAILILVWWAARGFGPRFTRGTDSNPKLDEHLSASGAFFIKHRAETLVVQEYRTTLLRKVARSLNLPLNSTARDLLEAADEQDLLTAEELAAMSQPLSEKSLITTLRNLQSINQKL